RLRFSGPKTSIICSPMTSLKTSIKTITYLSDTGCLEIQGASLLSKKDSVFVSDLLREAKANELDEPLSTTRLNHLIDKGYERITLQLDLGGESPGYLGNGANLLI
ncbi:hypothetical protein AADO33_25645, partial [Escherichia coli]